MDFAFSDNWMTIRGLSQPERAQTLIQVSRSLHYAALLSRTTGRPGWFEMEQLGDIMLRDHEHFLKSDQACSQVHQDAMRLLSLWECQFSAESETLQ